MWTPLSASRWMLLLTLGVVMLLSESEANHHDCCYEDNLTDEKVGIEDIDKCFKQTSSSVCGQEAYLIKPKAGDWKCIDPKADWLKELKDLIAQGKIDCPDRFQPKAISEVLDEEEEEEEDEDEEEEEEE